MLTAGGAGIMDETYYQALDFIQKSTREGGIDTALKYNGSQLAALLVPPDVGQTYQIAAQAGMSLDSEAHQDLLSSSHDAPPKDTCRALLTTTCRLSYDYSARRRQCGHRNAIWPGAYEYGLVRGDSYQVCLGNRRLAVHFWN